MKGDHPLAMPFYTLSTILHICKLPDNVVHAWYADDASACGKVSHLCLWWDQFPLLDHHLATSLMPPRLGLLSKNSI